MDSMKGTVVISAYPSLRVHTYVSPPDGWLVTTPIVEGPEELVIFDGQLLNAYAEEVAAYAHSLRKPVERIIVSHAHPDHWAGLEVLSREFADAPISALPTVSTQIRAGGETMLARLRGLFGDADHDARDSPDREHRTRGANDRGRTLRVSRAERCRIRHAAPGPLTRSEGHDGVRHDLLGYRSCPYTGRTLRALARGPRGSENDAANTTRS